MSSRWEMDRARIGWWVVAGLLFASLVYVVYAFVGTFVFGVFIYYATRPVYRRLKRRTRHSNLAAVFSLLALALPALLLVAYTIAVGLQELRRALERRAIELGQLEPVLRPYFDLTAAIQDPQTLLQKPSALQALADVWNSLSGYLGFVGTAALHLFVMITIAFYLLRDDHRLAAWFERRFSDDDGVVAAYGAAVDRDFSNIFFGTILNAALTALIGAVSYSLLDLVAPAPVDVPYPVLLGLLTGVASLVPVVGMKLVYVPTSGYLAFTAIQSIGPRALWFPALFFAVSFVVVDVIPDLVLRPYVSGRGLHLGMVMLAYVFGPIIWGWYGIFLGPMLLVLLVHFVRLILPELLAGEPIEPGAADEAVTTPTPAEGGPAADVEGGHEGDCDGEDENASGSGTVPGEDGGDGNADGPGADGTRSGSGG